MTHDGRAVAVKIQYPGVDEAIKADLDNLDMATIAMPFVWKNLDVKGIVEEIRARLDEELDYTCEARNQRQFADVVPRPSVDPRPRRGRRASAPVEGPHHRTGRRRALGELETWDQAERDLAAETIYRFVFRSLYCFHAFNGDPHPGNYLFRPGGQVTFLDFGLVKHYSDDEADQMMDLAHHMVDQA